MVGAFVEGTTACGPTATPSRHGCSLNRAIIYLTHLWDGPYLCVSVMANTKPYVAVALVCENVIEEKDGVLTAFRIVDTFFVPPRPPGLPPEVQAGIAPTLLVGVKAGDLRGTFQLKLRLRPPTGQTVDVGTQSVLLSDKQIGANVIIKFQMAAEPMGLYWFDVYWDKDLLTSIPLTLAPQPQPTAETAAIR